MDKTKPRDDKAAGRANITPAPDKAKKKPAADRQREIGGRDGPEPTRYGDWEKNGRAVDF